MMGLGERIRALRNQNNVSQGALAKAIGSAASTLSEIELGKRNPRISLLTRIADYFGVSTDYLIGRPFHAADFPAEVLELLNLAIETGYKGDFKEFLLWRRAKNIETLGDAGVKDDLNYLINKARAKGLTIKNLISLVEGFEGLSLKTVAELPSKLQKELGERIDFYVMPYIKNHSEGDDTQNVGPTTEDSKSERKASEGNSDATGVHRDIYNDLIKEQHEGKARTEESKRPTAREIEGENSD